MADKDAAPPPAEEMKVEDGKSDAKAVERALCSNEDFGEVGFNGLRVAEPDIVDTPKRVKSEAIVEPQTIKKVVADDSPYTSARLFEDLNLPPELLQGLYSEMKFEKQGHNSSAKTTCFVLGMLSRVDP